MHTDFQQSMSTIHLYVTRGSLFGTTTAAAVWFVMVMLLTTACTAAAAASVPVAGPPPIISRVPSKEDHSIKNTTSTNSTDSGGLANLVAGHASNHSEDDAPPHRRAFAAAYFEIGPGAPSYVVLPGTYWVRFSNGFYLCAFDDGTMRQTPRMYGWERITVLPGPTPGTSYLYTYQHNKYIIDPVFILGMSDRAPVQSPTPTATVTTFFTISASREVRIGGASVNQPRGVGSFPYRIASPRYNSSAQWVETTYLRAPTTGEYEGFVYKAEGTGFVPPPEMDFISVRTLVSGTYYVRTRHKQFICVFPQEAFLSRVRPTNAQLAWERIRVIKADENEYGRNRYHLWSDAQQRYLAFEPNGLGVRTGAFSWETFRIVSHPKHAESLSIFSDYHGKFLRQACNGCGFDATLSNTDGADSDVTAFDFIPRWMTPEDPDFPSGSERNLRFETTGKYLTYNLDTMRASQGPSPYGITLIHDISDRNTNTWLRVTVNGVNYFLDRFFNVQSEYWTQQRILPHPKMHLRHIIRLCPQCPDELYLAADPNGVDLTATFDPASDAAAIVIHA